MSQTLNLFYREPEGDRWLPYDRYPRRLVRRLVRGKPRPGGQMTVFLNLLAGLNRLNINYRVNDFRYARKHPEETVGVIGKPFLLDDFAWENPILFGAATFSHPVDDPKLFDRLPVGRMLVPGPWMEEMFREHFDATLVHKWPAGIDSEYWAPAGSKRDIEILVYVKFLWERERNEEEFLKPLLAILEKKKLKFEVIRYGEYQRDQYNALLQRSKAMVFLCEHETQGIAYQEALSCNVPVLAYTGNKTWLDPEYFPDKVEYHGVTSVPYWDDRCGLKFTGIDDFRDRLEEFLEIGNQFKPREYILENLTLEESAQQYVKHYKAVGAPVVAGT